MIGARILVVVASLHAGAAVADATAEPAADNRADGVTICYNYGCYVQARVNFTVAQFDNVARLFASVKDAAGERKALGRAIGRMYYFAGESTPIWHDHGENFWDDGANGKMDCIDHSHNTDAFLTLLKARGLLRFHDVVGKLRRRLFFFGEHWTARIAEISSGAEYAVDSWYFDPGEPAAVMPIADWLRFKDPRG